MSKPLALQSARGYTLIELAVVIAVLGILTAFAVVSFGNTGERRDATMVQAAQANLQSIISQGSVRMDTRPDQLPANMVLTAIQMAVGEQGASNQRVRFTSAGNQYTMSLDESSRSATFDVTNTGDVRLIGLNNFPNYVVDRTNAVWTIRKGP